MSGKKQLTATGKAMNQFDFIREFQKKNGRAPTLREIADEFRISTSVVNYYLNSLRSMKLIEKTPKVARGIRVIEHHRRLIAYTCPMPECTFFTSSKSIPCPDHPEQTLLKTELIEMESE